LCLRKTITEEIEQACAWDSLVGEDDSEDFNGKGRRRDLSFLWE
jgi:hypothetical protein